MTIDNGAPILLRVSDLAAALGGRAEAIHGRRGRQRPTPSSSVRQARRSPLSFMAAPWMARRLRVVLVVELPSTERRGYRKGWRSAFCTGDLRGVDRNIGNTYPVKGKDLKRVPAGEIEGRCDAARPYGDHAGDPI